MDGNQGLADARNQDRAREHRAVLKPRFTSMHTWWRIEVSMLGVLPSRLAALPSPYGGTVQWLVSIVQKRCIDSVHVQ